MQEIAPHTEGTPTIANYSGRALMRAEGDRRAGQLAAGIAFPMVPDFATLDEFRRHGCHHNVSAAWALRGSSKAADGGEFCPIAVNLHDSASCFFSPTDVPFVSMYLGKGETL